MIRWGFLFLFAFFLNTENSHGALPEDLQEEIQADRAGNGFTLTKTHDSLYFLNDWRLPYPVYRFDTADVNDDGKTEALVGVIKGTRFYPEKARRIFIFKLLNGRKVRPLWLGSKLGGVLLDFRCVNGYIRSMEYGVSHGDTLYYVAEWKNGRFGPHFERYLAKEADLKTAKDAFEKARTD